MKANNYALAIATTAAVSVGLVISILLLHGFGHFELSPALYWLVYGSNSLFFMSQMVAGTSYVNRSADVIFKQKNILGWLLDVAPANAPTPSNTRHYAILFGIGLALFFSILQIICHVHSSGPKREVLGYVCGAMMDIIGNFATFCGLGNRCAMVKDYYTNAKKKPQTNFLKHEQVNYTLGIFGGALIGLALSLAIIFLMGTSSALSFGAAVPVWFNIAFFLLSTTSTCASASGYIGRCFDIGLGNHPILTSKPDNNHITMGPREQKGTVIGCTLGIILATTLIVCGLFSLPLVGLGLPKIVAGILLMATCVSASGGLGNRLGQMTDIFVGQENSYTKVAQMLPSETPAPALTPVSYTDDAAVAAETSDIHSPVAVNSQSVSSLGHPSDFAPSPTLG